MNANAMRRTDRDHISEIIGMADARETLPNGTVIGPYRITRPLARGGFSLIYLACDTERGDKVVIKELMPKKITRRLVDDRVGVLSKEYTENFQCGRKLFFQEARALALIDHPNIVDVLNLLLANNTGYLVMPYESGRNLSVLLRDHPDGLDANLILEIFVPILDALATLHARALLHLDVKPGNIHVRGGNRPLLLDLGAVCEIDAVRRQGGRVVTAGYSPIEQYLSTGRVGPWTDVYAVGASIRACIDGKTPASAPERRRRERLVPAVEAFDGLYPSFLLTAVDWAMALEPEDRPQNAGELLRLFRPQLGGGPGWELVALD